MLTLVLVCTGEHNYCYGSKITTELGATGLSTRAQPGVVPTVCAYATRCAARGVPLARESPPARPGDAEEARALPALIWMLPPDGVPGLSGRSSAGKRLPPRQVRTTTSTHSPKPPPFIANNAYTLCQGLVGLATTPTQLN